MGRVYDLQEWKRVRKAHLLYEPLCRECKKQGRLRPAYHVDHVIPISKGGDWFSRDNLQSLCDSCHSLKTAKDEGKQVRVYDPGCTSSGIPLDKRHPWNS